VRTFWKEGKVDEAVEAVRDMERRGVIGTGSVYYELACCLCNYGRWNNAILEVIFFSASVWYGGLLAIGFYFCNKPVIICIYIFCNMTAG